MTGDNTGTLNLSFGEGELVSLLGGGFTATLEVSDGAGGWTPVDVGGVSGGLLDLLGLFGSSSSAEVDGLAAGQYRFTLAMDPAVVAVGASATAQLSVDNESLVDFDTTGGDVSGNVITDNGVTGLPDSPGTGADATVQTVNGEPVDSDPAVGTVVQGLYGELTIFANGDYSYSANGDPANIGKVDTFAYQLTTPAGGTASANLYVHIDSTDSTVIWDPADPSAPGVIELVATDDIATAQIAIDNVVETESVTALSYSPPVVGSRTANGEAVLIDADSTAELVVSRSFAGIGVLPTTTIVLQHLENGVWTNVAGQSTTNATHTFTGLMAGESYRVSSTTGALISAGTITVAQTLNTTHLDQFVTGAATAATGNVLLAGDHSVADSLGSSLTVLSVLVNGVYVMPGQVGSVVQGLYGTLTLHADGNYSYTTTPGLALADVGKVDSFTYKLTTPSGQEDTATLYVRVDSPDRDLVWDDANPGDPATEAPGFAAASIAEDSSQATITEGTDGADQIAIHDTEFAAVDGGAGFDTLLWNGGDATVDLSLLVGKVSDIESIDLNDFSAVDLTVSLEDLLAVTAPETDRLFIEGDEQDSVHLTGNWSVGTTQLENGQEYVVYTSQEDETHQLWVQSGINVV
ncbi:MAG: BapA/Bap/LapF family large adhesin [Pseudomonas taetrolens]|uniref:BapA/Bap/LapF family large adhesin n=1 Tax=Pseudomonas taetrolens TaxID=47884 RepID=UPI003F9A0DE0